MPKIRRSVYIGLGGTGIKAIAHTKKMFEDVFGVGHIPPQIAFVAIDFDKAIVFDPQLSTNIDGDFIDFPNAVNPQQTYVHMSSKGLYKWLFPKNANYLPNSIQNGASQVRTTGRLLTEMMMPGIKWRIDDAIHGVMNFDCNHEGYELQLEPFVDVHIAMSLAGGSGGGSFIPIAQYIKASYRNYVRLFGYGVLHNVFRAMDPSGLTAPRVGVNAYASVLELDYFQRASHLNPVSLVVDKEVMTITYPLFDNFYLVDNKKANGDVILQVNDICQILGTHMYLWGGELGVNVRWMLDHEDWIFGRYNWDDKLGWAHSMGLYQVVYKGDQLAQIYALKANIELIRQLLTPGADVEQMATNWTEVAGVREDGDDYNMLIDGIFSPESLGKVKEPSLSADDPYEMIKSDVDKYVDNLQAFPEKAIIHKLRDEILSNLNAKVAAIVGGDCGVANARTFLETLSTICAGYKNEMETERMEKLSSVESKRNTLYVALKDYQDYLKGWFPTKSGKLERLGDIARQAKVILKEKFEARRREEAAEIFANLINEINNALTNVKELETALGSLKNSYSEELAKKQNSACASDFLFEYDLSYKERFFITLNKGEVLLSDFVNSLKAPLVSMQKDEFAAALEDYTASLPRTTEYKEKLIEEVIEELDDDEYYKLRYEVNRKLDPLLRIDDKGLYDSITGSGPRDKMCIGYFVFTYKENKGVKSRIEKDREFFEHSYWSWFQGSDVDNMKQCMIFSRNDYAVIPYCITSLDTAAEEYYNFISQVSEEGRFYNPHSDLQIYEEMKEKDFRLKPKK